MTIKGHFLLKTQNLHGVTVIYAIYLLIGAFKADYILNIRSYIHQITHRPDSACYVMLCYVMLCMLEYTASSSNKHPIGYRTLLMWGWFT